MNKPFKWTKADLEPLQHLHLAEAARRLGTSATYLLNMEGRWGLSFQRIQERAKKKGYSVNDYAARQHMTQREAADDLGVTVQSVCQMAKRYGLTFRRDHGDVEVRTNSAELLEAEICHLLSDEDAVRFAEIMDTGARMHEALRQIRKGKA